MFVGALGLNIFLVGALELNIFLVGALGLNIFLVGALGLKCSAHIWQSIDLTQGKISLIDWKECLSPE